MTLKWFLRSSRGGLTCGYFLSEVQDYYLKHLLSFNPTRWKNSTVAEEYEAYLSFIRSNKSMRFWREFPGNRLNVTSLAADERVQSSDPHPEDYMSPGSYVDPSGSHDSAAPYITTQFQSCCLYLESSVNSYELQKYFLQIKIQGRGRRGC